MSTSTESIVRVRTNAKLNLFLRVAGKRSDGYHEVESIFHGVGLADDLTITPLTSGDVEVEMTLEEGLRGQLPVASENLIAKAIERLVERGAHNPGIKIVVLKRIPIAAGLGGGSGNAAGVLVALNEMWRLSLDKEVVMEAAGEVGSDVPYCVGGGTALAMARGQQITVLPAHIRMWFVLGVSFDPLSTSAVYKTWDEFGRIDDAGSAPMALALGAGDVAEVASMLHNDLERAAFKMRPELTQKKQLLIENGALGAAMSGSGPTMYGIAKDERDAVEIAGRVSSAFDRVYVVSSVPHCVERVD